MKAFESSNLSTSAFATPKPERAEAGFAWLRRDTVRLQKSEVLQRDEVGSNAKICFMYYVYSIKCKDGFYIGCTDNLKDRLNRHTKGYIGATKDRRPINLEIYFAIKDKYKAFEFEKYLKTGSGRAFIKKHF